MATLSEMRSGTFCKDGGRILRVEDAWQVGDANGKRYRGVTPVATVGMSVSCISNIIDKPKLHFIIDKLHVTPVTLQFMETL